VTFEPSGAFSARDQEVRQDLDDQVAVVATVPSGTSTATRWMRRTRRDTSGHAGEVDLEDMEGRSSSSRSIS
jgi:hypothetical protein